MIKIAIISGKGGTGKTMVATGLYKYLSRDYKVNISDLDVECPDSAIYLNNKIFKDSVNVSASIPSFNKDNCTGCKKCEESCNFKAISYYDGNITIFSELCKSCLRCINACPENALTIKKIEYGKISTYKLDENLLFEGQLTIGQIKTKSLITEVKSLAEKSECTFMLYDSPPGTTCPMVASVYNVDMVILVAEDSPYGLNDFILAYEVVNEMKLKSIVIINKFVLDNSVVKKYCDQNNIKVTASIPYQNQIHSKYSKGQDILEINEINNCFSKITQHITGEFL